MNTIFGFEALTYFVCGVFAGTMLALVHRFLIEYTL